MKMATMEKYGYLNAAVQCRVIKDRSVGWDRSVNLNVCQKKEGNQITKNKSLIRNILVIDAVYYNYDVICLIVTTINEETTADN